MNWITIVRRALIVVLSGWLVVRVITADSFADAAPSAYVLVIMALMVASSIAARRRYRQS